MSQTPWDSSAQTPQSAPNTPGGYTAGSPTLPANRLGMAIWAMLLFWPVGIFALLKAGNVNTLWAQGRYAESIQTADSARNLAKIGVIVGVIFYVTFIVAMIAMIAFVFAAAGSAMYY
ncbi:CD225/dispanin family protein [Hoyosella rhizosphaerae]|uniref:Interferon-induced transmembrane protein n=1 Tax=Hoyosella rhizosphaerae TaxID=1755582 RepID=A0A916X8F5_9ACTN|nr:CD225/dispanin family protein [Hoyosella rhizosphaerae]MBN4927091.1 CD225/dispanin family protein [Hoyosella rhizosphaerae]GGC54126.1 hypothetical protein GCM10011410_03070 [Hoyosella rhizosphaerae]